MSERTSVSTSSPAAIRSALDDLGYLADEGLSTVVFLALAMHRPLFLEGEPGAGKTELGRTLARLTGGELIRLPADEQATLIKTLGDVGLEVSKTKPAVAAAYQIVTTAAQRLR